MAERPEPSHLAHGITHAEGQVFTSHFGHHVFKGRFWFPAQFFFGLGRIAQQGFHFGGTEVAWVHPHNDIAGLTRHSIPWRLPAACCSLATSTVATVPVSSTPSPCHTGVRPISAAAVLTTFRAGIDDDAFDLKTAVHNEGFIAAPGALGLRMLSAFGLLSARRRPTMALTSWTRSHGATSTVTTRSRTPMAVNRRCWALK